MGDKTLFLPVYFWQVNSVQINNGKIVNHPSQQISLPRDEALRVFLSPFVRKKRLWLKDSFINQNETFLDFLGCFHETRALTVTTALR